MERDNPVNLRVEMAPDDGSFLLTGSITITRTTMSVFKLCEMDDEEPLFIGVCSVPLLKIARQKSKVFVSSESLLLMSLSEHLFVNASLTAGILPPKEVSARSTRTTSSSIYTRTPKEDYSADVLQRLDNPASWKLLRLEFSSPEAFDRCLESLLARKAEEITRDYTDSSRHSRDIALPKTLSVHRAESLTSASSDYKRNQSIPVHSDNLYTCRSQPFDHDDVHGSLHLLHSKKELMPQPNSRRQELETPSGKLPEEYVQQGRGVPAGVQPISSQREKLTPVEFHDTPNTPRSSHRDRGLPGRSQPTDSYRELETPSDMRGPQNIQQGRGVPAGIHPASSQREKLTPAGSRNDPNTPYSSHRGRGLPGRSQPTDSYRELETLSDRPTQEYAQQGRGVPAGIHPASSQREKLTPAGSRNGPNTPYSSHRGRGLPGRSQPTDSCRELDTPSDMRGPQNIQQGRGVPAGVQPISSQREKLTPVEFRDTPSTPYSSHRDRGLPGRSQPTDSCRELDTPSDMRGPQNIQQGRGVPAGVQPISSQREKLTPVEFRDTPNTPRSSHRGRGLTGRSQPTDSCGELETPSEMRRLQGTGRESARDPRRELRSVSSSITDSNAVAKLLPLNIAAQIENQQVSDVALKSLRALPDVTTQSAMLRDIADPTRITNQMNNSIMRASYESPSEYPMTQRSGRSRTGHQYFLRNVMKLMHHRLHFMQYLHKELVYEAYLAEEAKLFGGHRRTTFSASGSRSISRPTSLSPRSPRRTTQSSLGEESARLREIEERLRSVEKLHREAEQERQEALRLRHEAEKKLELINRNLGYLPRSSSPLCGLIEPQQYDTLLQSFGTLNDDRLRLKNDSADFARPSNFSKVGESVASRASRMSPVRMGTGQITIVPTLQQHEVQHTNNFSEVDYSTTILDRYIYGDEWHLLYPVREADVRFSALIDVCLMLKLPRRLVTIMSVSVDQPGMRITAEIHHDRHTLPREVVERRFSSQPFYLLQRLYELRHCFSGFSSLTGRISHNSRHGSPSTSRLLTLRGNNRRNAANLGAAGDFSGSVISDETAVEDSAKDMEILLREMQRRTEERGRQREYDLADEREKKQMILQRERWRQQMDQLEQEEAYRRGRIVLSEAKERPNKNLDKDLSLCQNAIMSPYALEEEEDLERAMIEVGYARQMQVLAKAQRRNWAFVRIATQEVERRARLVNQESEDRLALNLIMNPQRLRAQASQPEVDERGRRQRLIEAEAIHRKQICANIRSFLADALQDAVEALISDEKAARMMVTADEMKGRLDVLCSDETSRNRELSVMGSVTPQLWQALLAEEVTERSHVVNDEERRRRLFQREYIVTTEDLLRNVLELQELDEHIVMLDDIVHRNRAMLERHRRERKELAQLATEEQYYRKGLLGDEQDEWEVLMELFDSEQNDLLLLEAARLTTTSDLETPQRRRRPSSTPRQRKPFHYMTFVPEDMDHPPSAALVIEGILGSSVNKNLEVTSISRPLPKVEEDDLQFQAGDMILDVAGYSLHSLSHLREVLSNRAMQIQQEAREEFAGIPEEEMTTNPALQKYIEVLCEHHNFLVQVLRGCDIFQIIVKS